MFKLCIYFCTLLKLSLTQNFPIHKDFEKVGTVKFKGENYKVLRPTVHVIKDYFKDYMLQKETSGIPSEKVFLDHNGFRHYWNGFAEDSAGNTVKSKFEESKAASSGKHLAKEARYGNQNELKTTFLCPYLGVISTKHYQEQVDARRKRSHKKVVKRRGKKKNRA